MTPDETFASVGPRELSRLKPFGFGDLQASRGAGFEAFTVFRDDEFVHLVREMRDQVVYCELGSLIDGEMPGWRDWQERMDLRRLTAAENLGWYDGSVAGIEDAIREVLDKMIEVGIPFLERRRS